MSKSLFYLLSFTWGLPMTLVGIVAGIFLTIIGKKAEKYGACWHFTIGRDWGGLNLGPVFITCEEPSDYTKDHEHGHAIQNCYYGFLMPFIVVFPSIVRYWYREFRWHINRPCITNYYDIWFEKQASDIGTVYVNKWNKKESVK